MKGIIILLCAVLVLIVSAGSAYGAQGPDVKREIVYCSHQGETPAMDIYYPDSADRPAPAVLYIHGGGWYSGDKASGTCRDVIHALTARGFLVAAVNYRLAPRYEFPAQIEDVRCAVRFLRANASELGLDPDRIGAFGESAGGHLAALLGVTGDTCLFEPDCDCTEQPVRVQAVADMFGPTDLAGFFSRQSAMFMEHTFGAVSTESRILKEASPVTHVSGDAPPFLIIHGEKDEQVLPEQSEKFYAALSANQVPVTYISVKNAGHNLVPCGGRLDPGRPEIIRSIVSFFENSLK